MILSWFKLQRKKMDTQQNVSNFESNNSEHALLFCSLRCTFLDGTQYNPIAASDICYLIPCSLPLSHLWFKIDVVSLLWGFIMAMHDILDRKAIQLCENPSNIEASSKYEATKDNGSQKFLWRGKLQSQLSNLCSLMA